MAADPGVDERFEQLLEERNRLWAELQRARALEREAEHWRSRALALEASITWRASEPLRRLIRDPLGTLVSMARRLRGSGSPR